MDSIIETRNLTKVYSSRFPRKSRVVAVDNSGFHVGRGQIFGILGPNGSGKTTTFGMLLSVIHPDNGEILLFNSRDLNSARKRMGCILESPNFYPYLSGENNLRIAAKIKGVPPSEIPNVLETVGLYERRKSAFKTYSLGMKQRLALASALLGNPELLMLDEPTNGMDPAGIVEIRNLIVELAAKGKTILLASHLLNEVEKVCTHVAIIHKGKIIRQGKVSEILTRNPWLKLAAENLDVLQKEIAQFPGVVKVQRDHEFVFAEMNNPVPSEVNKFLAQRNIFLTHLSISRQNLEEAFIQLTSG